ncbi:hypothetical protein FQN49_000529 [Arthroderma sp. PD_2]|nr:hypothetical protein FQN49_000529 [Arthroderma sp. PD_2]
MEINEKLIEVQSRIQALYDDGVPFFTKAVLREIYEQIKDPLEEGQTILVRGLDGELVEFDVETGVSRGASPPSLEHVSTKPHICYQSMQLFKQQATPGPFAYCNLKIYHDTTLRDKVTEESVVTMPTSNYSLVKARFDKSLSLWESSRACRQLTTTVSNMIFPRDFKIDKIIGFACGPISHAKSNRHDKLSLALREKSFFQHGLLRTLQKTLQEEGFHNIDIFVQDPAYTDVDCEVLSDYGIITLDDPEGFLALDDRSLVMSCDPGIPVKQIVADIARPAMIIWDTNSNEEVF